ncbi:MAG: Stk1 family PASTA domain-containing Ser/Thr kinase [Clostridia bacterium]|nr:Stk1 family PASTA domain-containing Ser/Thr kinase [Clostridia bacterium]
MDSIDNTKFIGKTLDDRYRIKSLVGSGGMSRVFLVDDLVLHRELALKMLREDISKDEAAVRRFIHESKAVSMLSHPNIVSVYDVSVTSDVKYIVLEYAEGITLKEYLQEHGPLTAEETIHIAVQILSGLQHAHSRGIIHRDIKPQNIIIAPDGSIKVTDFGIAKIPNSETITMADKAIGSVHYISPEQASGLKVDLRSDLYSLGIILYELICNRVPFEAENAVAVACMQISSRAVPPSEFVPDVPKGLEQIVMKAISKRPADRFENAAQMLSCLERLETTPDAVFDFVTVNEESGEDVIPTEVDGKAEDESIEMKVITPSDTKKKKKQRKEKPPVEIEVVYEKRRAPMLPIIFGMLCAFGAVVLVVLLYLLQHYFITDPSDANVLIVGDFVHETYSAEMKQELESQGYTVTVEWVASSDYLANTIISQTPEKDARRQLSKEVPTCQLTLIVSSGENLVTLPDYTGTEYREAKLDLQRRKIKYTVQKIYNNAVDEGLVISTYPAAGSIMGSETEIILYVSKGGENSYISIPYLTGMTAAQLKDTLKSLDIRMGKVSYVYSDTVAPGLIISQSPVAGTTVQTGITSVNIVVSLGPKIEVPDVPEPTPDQTQDSADTSDQTTDDPTVPETSDEPVEE